MSEPIYQTEVSSVTCGTDDLPFDYSLFASKAEMDVEYLDDVANADTPPEEGGTCGEGNFEGEYTIADVPAGRLNCREHTSDSGFMFHVLEWTNEELLVIGYMSNNVDVHTWDELITFWQDEAGPFTPD